MQAPSHAVIWDAEFLTDEGAMQRMWCGPNDPDPTAVQLGAVTLQLDDDFDIINPFSALIQPRDRHGRPVVPTAFFAKLTGLTPERIAREGEPLAKALARFAVYCREAPVWAWGKDEFHAIAISCYIEGIEPPMQAWRFGNGPTLLLRAGLSVAEIQHLRSHTMLEHFGLPSRGEAAHDALGDAQAVARVYQHLLRRGQLKPEDFALAPART